MNYQQAIDMQFQKEQAGNVYSGPAMGMAGQCNAPPTPDNMSMVIKLLFDQASELREQSKHIADVIAGTEPETKAMAGNNGSASLVGALRQLSNQIGESLMELRRARQVLS